MDLSRIKQLREALEAENIDLEELSEIEAAFAELPDSELRDLRENAMAGDMLDELEERITPVERFLYDYVEENYGEGDDPCYALGPLAAALNEEFNL